MKLINTLITALLLLTNTISLLAFRIEKNKPSVTTIYYYVSGTPYQRTLWNTNPISTIEKSIDKDPNSPPYFKRISSWTTSPVAFTPTSSITSYIGSITFNEETTMDGGSDGELTLQESIDALYTAYMNNQAMPSVLVVDGNATINFTGANSAH